MNRSFCCRSRNAFFTGIIGLYFLMRPSHSFSCFHAISSKVLTMTGLFIYFNYCFFLKKVTYQLNCLISSEQLLVLIEYVPFGDLLGYLRKSRGLKDTYYKDPDIKPQTNLTSQQLMRFSWQIADGMSYLSAKSVS